MSHQTPIVDAHVHLFPPEVISGRERFGARDPFFGYLYSSPRASMVGVNQMLADMDEAGVAQVVLAGWPWQQGDLSAAHNDWTIQVVQANPQRVLGLATLQPTGAAALRELHRCLAAGLVGVGELNADGQRFRLDDPAFLALAHEMAELGVPLLLHTNEPVGHAYPGKGSLPLADVYAMIRALPGLRLVLAHWGGGFPFYELMPEVRAAAGNVFYDSAASPLLYRPQVFRSVIDLVGSSKVIYGSDYPLVLHPRRQAGPSFGPLLAEVAGLGLPPAALADVLGRNALGLYRQPVSPSAPGDREERR